MKKIIFAILWFLPMVSVSQNILVDKTIEYYERNFLNPTSYGQNVLFWHEGGISALVDIYDYTKDTKDSLLNKIYFTGLMM